MNKAKPSKGGPKNKRSSSKTKRAIKTKKTAKKKNAILSTMSVFEAVSRFPKTAEIFMKYGLHCFGCSVARYENLAQAAQVHGVPEKKFLEELNKAAK